MYTIMNSPSTKQAQRDGEKRQMESEPKQDGFSLLKEMVNSNAQIMCCHDRMVMCDSAQGRGGFMKYSQPNSPFKSKGIVVGPARCMVAPNPISDEVFYKYGMTPENSTLCSSEWRVANVLLRDCKFLPNFMRPYGIMTNRVIVEPRRPIDTNLQTTELRDFDPFATSQRNVVRRVVDVGIFESLRLLQPGNKLANAGAEVVASTIYQLSMAVLIAQQRSRFTHNDLHIDNVMLASCPYNLCIFYNYKRENGVAVRRIVPTYGIIPIIIDYGFAYVRDHDNHHPEVLFADNLGYITYEHDSVVDITRMLHEFAALLPEAPLSQEISAHLKELNISSKDGRHKLGARVPNSWEATDSALQVASYTALCGSMPRVTRLDRMIYEAVRVSNGVANYECRVRNLTLYNGAAPEDEIAKLNVLKLEEILSSDLLCLTAEPDAKNIVCTALSDAVRHGTEVMTTPAVKTGSRTPSDLYLNRLNIKEARSQFLSLLNARLAAAKRNSCAAAISRIKTCNATRMVCTLFAMVAIRMSSFFHRVDDDVVHVRRGIKLPVRRYSSPIHTRNTATDLRAAFARFYSKWNMWRDEARMGAEVEFVARRSLSRVILDSTRTARSTSETTYAIDMTDSKAALMRRLRSDLESFNIDNDNNYGEEVKRALQVMDSSFLVDWHNICYAWAEITAAAGNMFNAAVKNLRKFRSETIHAATGSGEKLFFRYEEAIYRAGRIRCTRPLTDPVLIIDAVEGTSRMSDVGGLQELKRGAIVKRKRAESPIRQVQVVTASPELPAPQNDAQRRPSSMTMSEGKRRCSE